MNRIITQQLRKNFLRKKFKSLRKNLSEKTIKIRSLRATYNFFKIENTKDCKNFGLYLPINKEVETKDIIDKLGIEKKNVFLPKFLNSKWIFVKFHSWDKLEKGPFGISQPLSHDSLDPSRIEIAVFPGIAFDILGNRLGYGFGVYDRLFANSKAIRIGLGFEDQIAKEIPVSDNDLKMNFVVTEARILVF